MCWDAECATSVLKEAYLGEAQPGAVPLPSPCGQFAYTSGTSGSAMVLVPSSGASNVRY